MAGRATSAAAALLLVSAACRTAAPTLTGRAPDPLAPPVPGPVLADAQRNSVRTALSAAERGDAAAAERAAARLPTGHPVTRLTRLEIDYLQGRSVSAAARAFATELASYPAAWQLAVDASIREGRPDDALDAARLWQTNVPSDVAAAVVSRLEAQIVDAGRAEVESLIASGRPDEALEHARQVLERVPGAAEARESVVRAALAAGRPRDAAALVPSLPDDPASIALKARVAEGLGQWELAARLYESLPSGTPGRCEGLIRARQQWRLADAPPYLRGAVEASTLRRRGLAAILMWECPELAVARQAPVPVFEDLVQVPEQGDILAVARDGVMRGDALTRRFFPDRLVRPDELRSTLDRLARVLGRASPRWCGSGGGDACVDVPAALDGATAAALVRRVARDGGEGCR